jgi:hypothetical protein
MKPLFILLFSFLLTLSCNQKEKEVTTKPAIKTKTEAQQFWNNLQSLCNQSFEGKLVLPEDDEQFGGKKLIMHVKSCHENEIKIPFFVGDDRSRTWVLTFDNNRILLKHDHRHEDGSEDDITMYGGKTTNAGQANIQIFPADEETKIMIPKASTNVWWITLNETEFTYNLRRLGTKRVFRVVFNLTKIVETPSDPWGWKD